MFFRIYYIMKFILPCPCTEKCTTCWQVKFLEKLNFFFFSFGFAKQAKNEDYILNCVFKLLVK